MIVKLDKDVLLEKMEELCTLLLNQQAYSELRKMVDQFSDDQQANEQYDDFIEKYQFLQEKEQQNIEVTQAEIDELESVERSLYENDVIRQFLFAQREFSQLHNLISQYYVKTIELNRLPKPKELKTGGCGCGGSCGCGGGH